MLASVGEPRESSADELGRRIRVLIAHERPLLGEWARAVFERERDFAFVGHASDGLRALKGAEAVRPDVAVISAELPPFNGFTTTRMLIEELPSCRVLILAETEDEQAVASAIYAGAVGFTSARCSSEELVEASRAIHRGQMRVPEGMLGSLLRLLLERRNHEGESLWLVSTLSPRQREIVALLARGMTTKAIAHELGIRPETARTHIQRAMSKLGLHSRLQVAAFVRRNAILGQFLHLDSLREGLP